MVEMELMGVKGAEIEDVWPKFPLVTIRRQGLGPQRLGPGDPSYTDQLEWLALHV